MRDDSGDLIALEADPATEADAALAEQAGLVPVREVRQLRRPLPMVESCTITTRRHRPGVDDADLLAVNNRAFHWHPDQSGWTIADLEARRAETWFDGAGFLVHETDGVVDAFCWTKVHPPTDTDPELGEIYVIAVDPSAHGRGLGTQIVLAGLAHLADRGVAIAMLHVEGDNDSALRMYDRLGFAPHHSHRWWARPGTPTPAAIHR